MKKNMKKNNKGFSLVELIVVVLIMGIIAVALAPQVMKWVGESRKSSDKNNANSLKSSIQVALAEWQQSNSIATGSGAVTLTAKVGDNDQKDSTISFGSSTTGWTNVTALETAINNVTAGDYPVTQDDTNGFTVKIYPVSGKVEVTCGATSN